MTDHFGRANSKHRMIRCTVTKFVATQSAFQRPAPENARPHTDTRANRARPGNNSCSLLKAAVAGNSCMCVYSRVSSAKAGQLQAICKKTHSSTVNTSSKATSGVPDHQAPFIHIYYAVTLRTLQMPYDKVFERAPKHKIRGLLCLCCL